MLQHPQIDPVALHLGPLSVHWYGLTYLAAFALFYVLARLRLKHQPFASVTQPAPWTMRDVEDLLFWGVLGVILGGRLGYVLFYKPAWYASHPLEIFAIWQGGMSFHGGMLGVILAMMLWAWKKQRPWLQVTDLVAPCVPTGLAAGRMGNFINGELWGRVASPDLPWGMVFRGAGDLPRHPSQIYQALLEGMLLFVLLWLRAPAAQDGAGQRRFSRGLRRDALCRGVFPRAGRPSGPAGAGSVDGPVAVRAHDRHWPGNVGLGQPPLKPLSEP